MGMEEKRNEEVELAKATDEEEVTEPESSEMDNHFDKIYSNIASNRYENLRTSYIENKAKELRKKHK
ncbi:MAG TPA: hypothetical protein VLQ20_09475 [Planococcus sp. (in: firmicutes)]|nr:hypothetical protein [Planococcus sp. (in: firmicutes)]